MIDSARLQKWREDYRQNREAAFTAYLARPRVRPLLTTLTRAVDDLLQQIWAASALPPCTALIAVGGYGRGEQFPHSDVDLLILIDDDLPDADLARFEPLIALLWDCGLPIGHSVRRLSDCLIESAGDLTIQTTLLEMRHLCGDAMLTARLGEHLRTALDPLAFLAGKQLEQDDRHGRFADRGLMLEPNLKDSPGGLRDLHTVDWAARASGFTQRGLDTLTAMGTDGLLSADEIRRLRAQRHFISHLRIRLHLTARRREERLLFEFQEQIAAGMGIVATQTRRAAEILMQRFFRTARAISLANEILLGTLVCRLNGPQQIQNPLLDIPDAAAFERNPAAILDCFLTLQRNPGLTGLTPRALRLLWRAAPRINTIFRRDPDRQAQFLAILHEPRGVTLALRLMHRLGLIGRYLPAFARITGQMQHDLYHIHPVDEHTLMLLRNLRRLALPEFAHEFPLAFSLMQGLAHPEWLYLAAIFHDIAKGRGGDHSVLGEVDMRRFCHQHRLPDEATRLLTWLVREHLSMSHVAQKQDLADPAVIKAFANHCGDITHLNTLYLLTLCDIRATRPALWNAWKDSLLKTLYHATRALLEGLGPKIEDIATKCGDARALLRQYGWPDNAEAPLWARLDEIWFLRQDAQEIAWQTRSLLPALARGETTIVCARLSPIGEGVAVLVHTPDKKGLFARICGFFAGMGYSVREARIHTTRDGFALDNFLVMDIAQEAIAYRDILNYIEYELSRTLTLGQSPAPFNGRLPRQLRAFPLTPQISLSRSEGRSDFVLSLTAGDRPGLLYDIAQTLAKHGVDVSTARIHTLGGRAEDVFVVTGPALSSMEQRLTLERALLESLRIVNDSS